MSVCGTTNCNTLLQDTGSHALMLPQLLLLDLLPIKTLAQHSVLLSL